MNPSTLDQSVSNVASRALPARAPAAARVVMQVLQRMQIGSLDVQWPDGSTARFGQAEPPAHLPRAGLRLHDWHVCGAALK